MFKVSRDREKRSMPESITMDLQFGTRDQELAAFEGRVGASQSA